MSVKPGKLLGGDDLLQSHICTDRSLPKVGEKLFKPTGSWLEKKQIQTALDETKRNLEEERVEKLGALAEADWYNNKKLALVTKKVGKFFQTMGFEKNGKLFIYPEEALYLMEMNCLQLNYDGVPLSVQQAYLLLLSSPVCSLKEYRTYSHLTKQGFRLLRYSKAGMATNYEHRIRLDQHVPHKRVFPEIEVEEVGDTTEIAVCDVATTDDRARSNTSPTEDSMDVECVSVSRTELSENVVGDNPINSEKDTGSENAAVNNPMNDFAKSIADMGESLVKTEKCGGSQGLGLENLRKKILDMLESHFQGQISPEAMDAVSLSASKAILVHVEDVDSEVKSRCTTPSVEYSDKSEDSNTAPGSLDATPSDSRVSGGSHSTSDSANNQDTQQENLAATEAVDECDLRAESLGRQESRKSSQSVSEKSEEELQEASKKNDSKVEEQSNQSEERQQDSKKNDSEVEEQSNQSEEERPEASKQSDSEPQQSKISDSEIEESSKESDSEPQQSKISDSEIEESSKESDSEREKLSKKNDSEIEGQSKKSDSALQEPSKKSNLILEEHIKESDSQQKETFKKSDSENEEHSKRSDSARDELSTKSNLEREETPRSGDVETERISKENGDTESRQASEESDIARENPLDKSDLDTEQPSKESEELDKVASKKSDNLEAEKPSTRRGDMEMEAASEKSGDTESGETSKKIAGLVTNKAIEKSSEMQTDNYEEPKTDVETTDVEVTAGCQSWRERKTGDTECESSEAVGGGSSAECSSSEKSRNICDKNINKNTELKDITDNRRTDDASSANQIISSRNEENRDVEDSEEDKDVREIPIEDCCLQEKDVNIASPKKQKGNMSASSGSTFSEDESDSEILEYEVFDADCNSDESMQVDDDVVEIEDPNTWKNVKVTRKHENGNKCLKRTFSDSNGWRNFKESQSENPPSKKAKQEVDVKEDIRQDQDIELIDISEDSCSKRIEEIKDVKPKREIEVVDLDESGSDSSETSEQADIKEKLPKLRPTVASAFERARDSTRKKIMDSFPNLIDKTDCILQVPTKDLLPPNINPVQSTYTIRRSLSSERFHPNLYPLRRNFNFPRFNNRYNKFSRHPHVVTNHSRPMPFISNRPRQPFNPQQWQGRHMMQNNANVQHAKNMQINPAAMQAFQMITSIVLPMFGINNMGPNFMGQPPWNQNHAWQQPQRHPGVWQQSSPWRFQQRPNNWNANRFNRPWHNRNFERDHQEVPDRPKRPALLSTPGQTMGPTPSPTPAVVTPGLATPEVVNNNRANRPVRSQTRRPKRPFAFENNYNQRNTKTAKDLLTDIEDEIRWKKIRAMNEGSDSDSEAEVTITPINPVNKSPELKPLLKWDHCTNSAEIMECVSVIKTADPRTLKVCGQNRLLRINYDVFQPSIPFKKSSPPIPSFRLCIMAIEERMPNPGEVSVLLDEIHDGVPLLFAVVHADDISFFQYSTVQLPKQTFSS